MSGEVQSSSSSTTTTTTSTSTSTSTSSAQARIAAQSLWNPFTLKFRDDELENTYRTETLAYRTGHDKFSYLIGIFIGMMKLDGSVGWISLWWRCICFVQSPFCAYLTVYKRDSYSKWRTYIVALVMSSSMVHHFVREAKLPPPEPTFADVLKRLLKSPTGLFPLSPSVFFPLDFRFVYLYSFPSMVGALYWSKKLCSVCAASGVEGAYTPAFDVFRGLNWNVASILSLGSFGVIFPAKLDCTSIMIFLQVLGGVLLPVYCVYISEVGSRAAFLGKHRMGEMDQARIHDFKKDCRSWSTWVFLVLVIVSYIVF